MMYSSSRDYFSYHLDNNSYRQIKSYGILLAAIERILSQKRGLKVIYHYDRGDNTEAAMTVCMLVDATDAVVAIGTAVCSKSDQFSRYYGRLLSLMRARDALNSGGLLPICVPRLHRGTAEQVPCTVSIQLFSDGEELALLWLNDATSLEQWDVYLTEHRVELSPLLIDRSNPPVHPGINLVVDLKYQPSEQKTAKNPTDGPGTEAVELTFDQKIDALSRILPLLTKDEDVELVDAIGDMIAIGMLGKYSRIARATLILGLLQGEDKTAEAAKINDSLMTALSVYDE